MQIETIKIVKDGQVVKINACDLENWTANGWSLQGAVATPASVLIPSAPEQAAPVKRGRPAKNV